MFKKLTLGVGLSVLIASAVLAGGQFTNQLPLQSTYGPLQGTETIPVDTNLAQGALPQTISVPVQVLRAGSNYIQQTPTTGFTITTAASTTTIQITPAGTLATGTIVFPTAATDGQHLRILSTQTQTALTLTPGTGQTINGGVTALTANVAVEYIYVASSLTWYRVL